MTNNDRIMVLKILLTKLRKQYCIIIFCDENGHTDRDESYEVSRENFIKSLGNTIIRFNPNTENFDLSTVLQQIIRIIV